MTAHEQLAAYRSRHVIAVLELPFVGVHQHLQAAGIGGGYSGNRHEHHDDGRIVGEPNHTHSPALVCKVDGIRLVRAGSHRPWRHDPDEIKRLSKAVVEGVVFEAETARLLAEATANNVTALDMAIAHLRELGVHAFKGRQDRGCEECLQPDRGIRHLRDYEGRARLKNIEGGANNGPTWRA